MHTPEILIREKGSSAVRHITLEQGVNSFGRSADNQIQLISPLVSRVHGTIRRWSSIVSLQDHRSTNGVRVNGQLVRHATLFTGDVVEVGPFVIQVMHGSVDPD